MDGSDYQAKYKRLKQRRGSKRAVVAIGHVMLVAIYHIIKKGESYKEIGARFLSDQ